jgi:hypothetical protein
MKSTNDIPNNIFSIVYLVSFNHRFLIEKIEGRLLLGHKTQQQIEWHSNHSNESSCSSEPSFEYSITGEQLLIMYFMVNLLIHICGFNIFTVLMCEARSNRQLLYFCNVSNGYCKL